MTKLLISSDWHVDANTAGVERFDEIQESVSHMTERAIELKVHTFVFLGDLMDPDVGSQAFRCMSLAVRTATTLAHHGIQSLWLAGNHDVIEDGGTNTTLSPLRYLYHPNDPKHSLVKVIDSPCIIRIGEANELVAMCLPFTNTAHTYDPAEQCKHLAMRIANGSSVVVFAHLNVEGIVPGSETTDMPRGRDVWFPYRVVCDELDKGKNPFALFNGHYHNGNSYYVGGKDNPPVHVPGSLARLTFGEEDNDPRFIVMDIEHG